MNENFLANAGESLYPESRGAIMPEAGAAYSGGDKESKKTPATNGETGKKESKAEERRRLQKEERDREQQKAAQNSTIEISFREAKKIAEVVTTVQAEKKVIVSPKELTDFKKVLVKGGYDSKAIEKMTDGQIVLVAQQVLKNAKIGQPQETDWQYSKRSPNRKAEEALVREQIAKAQSLDEGQLTPEKVAQFLEVEEFAKAAEGGGPGTMTAGDLPDEAAVTPEVARYIKEVRRAETIRSARARINALDDIESALRRAVLSGELAEDADGITEIREAVRQRIDVLSEGTAGVAPVMVDIETKEIIETLIGATGAEQVRLTSELDRKIARVEEIATAAEPANFQGAYLITKAAESALRTHKSLLVRAEMAEMRDKLEGLTRKETGPLGQIEQKFRAKYNSLSQEEQTAEVGDIDREAITFFKQIAGGLGVRLGEAKAYLFNMKGEDPTGLREWRVIRSIEGLENAIRVRQLTEGPVIWEEIPERIANIYSFIESTDFSVEELNTAIQEAISLVRLVPPDTPEARKERENLVKELEAFKAFHSFRITMQRVNMRAEEVMGVFKQYFTDTTWNDFVQRFGKDSKGRQFYWLERDKDGNVVRDAEGNPQTEAVNLFDVAEKFYFERLQEDRKKMNLVEGLTLVGIDKELSGEDFRAIQRLLGRSLNDEEKGQLAGLRQELSRRFKDEVDKDPKLSMGDWGRNIDKTKEVIDKWHEQNTLVGALASLPDKRNEMLRQLREKLDLEELQVEEKDGTKKKANLAELENIGFLSSIDYNAYYFAWTLAWSDYDIIRIYGRDPKDEKDPMIKASAYNQTGYLWWARHIDHWWEFLADEERGRTGKEDEVNELIRKKYPGRYHGLFDGNRTMVRFFDYFVSKEQKGALGFDDKVKELMQENDWGDPNSESVENKWIKEWAERIVMGELIDSGQVSFADKKFSKTAKDEIKQSQYLMTDLYYDRFFTTTYLNKENYQDYLANPTEGKLLEINNTATKYYSGRKKRLWPWMILTFRAHWEVAGRHRLRLFNDANLSTASAETVVDGLIGSGVIERKQGEKEKRKLFGFNDIAGVHFGEFFGTTPFRRARQSMETIRRGTWDSKFLLFIAFFAGLWSGTIELVKQLPKQIAGGR